ncbi:exocyst complex component exo70 [Thelotrema lepadinum]|nr:exocyst complex component exo70 [Thelotrema lepadinum]
MANRAPALSFEATSDEHEETNEESYKATSKVVEPPSPFQGPPPVSHTWLARPKDPAMAYRRNIEQHAEESAEVDLLLAQAKKHDEIGRKMKASLARLQGIGTTLQAAAGPVYNDTQSLQTTTQNADKMLSAINKMQSPLEGKADEERIIRDGPERSGLPNYLACLRRVEGKYDQLNRSQVRVNQEAAQDLSQLLVFGAKRLQELFEDTLKSSSEKVEPLQFITRNRPFPTLDQGKISQLAELQTFMSSPPRNSNLATQIYTDVRGLYLSSSLSNLASATLTTARRLNTDEIYRQGTCAIGTYATGVELSFAAEWANICGIFSPADRGRLLETTTGKALSEFARTLRDLNAQVKANMNTDCFLAYDVIGVVNNLAFEIDKRTGLLKQEIFGAVKPVRDTAKQTLGGLLEDVHRRVSAMTYLPMDCAAISLTAETIARLQATMAYPAPLGSIMSSVGDGNWMSSSNNSSSSVPTLKSFDVNPNSSSLLAHYAEDTMETLFRDLDSKSRAIHKQRNMTGLFLLNNWAVADRMVRSSELATLFPPQQPVKKLDNWRQKGMSAYVSNWKDLAATTIDTQNTGGSRGKSSGQRPPSGNVNPNDSAAFVKSLSSKEKDAIKEKFKNFNLMFESLCARHRELTPAMEQEVRQMLLREIMGYVDPMYKRFWERYHEIDKGKGKYVKYDPAALSGQMAGMA